MRISILTKKFALVGICAVLLLAVMPCSTMGTGKEPPTYPYTLEGYPYEGAIEGTHVCCNPFSLPSPETCQPYSEPCQFVIPDSDPPVYVDGEEAVHTVGDLTKTGSSDEGFPFDIYIPLGYAFNTLTARDLEGEGYWAYYPPDADELPVYYEVYKASNLVFTGETTFEAYIRVKAAKAKNPNSGPNVP